MASSEQNVRDLSFSKLTDAVTALRTSIYKEHKVSELASLPENRRALVSVLSGTAALISRHSEKVEVLLGAIAFVASQIKAEYSASVFSAQRSETYKAVKPIYDLMNDQDKLECGDKFQNWLKKTVYKTDRHERFNEGNSLFTKYSLTGDDTNKLLQAQGKRLEVLNKRVKDAEKKAEKKAEKASGGLKFMGIFSDSQADDVVDKELTASASSNI